LCFFFPLACLCPFFSPSWFLRVLFYVYPIPFFPPVFPGVCDHLFNGFVFLIFSRKTQFVVFPLSLVVFFVPRAPLLCGLPFFFFLCVFTFAPIHCHLFFKPLVFLTPFSQAPFPRVVCFFPSMLTLCTRVLFSGFFSSVEHVWLDCFFSSPLWAFLFVVFFALFLRLSFFIFVRKTRFFFFGFSPVYTFVTPNLFYGLPSLSQFTFDFVVFKTLFPALFCPRTPFPLRIFCHSCAKTPPTPPPQNVHLFPPPAVLFSFGCFCFSFFPFCPPFVFKHNGFPFLRQTDVIPHRHNPPRSFLTPPLCVLGATFWLVCPSEVLVQVLFFFFFFAGIQARRSLIVFFSPSPSPPPSFLLLFFFVFFLDEDFFAFFMIPPRFLCLFFTVFLITHPVSPFFFFTFVRTCVLRVVPVVFTVWWYLPSPPLFHIFSWFTQCPF